MNKGKVNIIRTVVMSGENLSIIPYLYCREASPTGAGILHTQTYNIMRSQRHGFISEHLAKYCTAPKGHIRTSGQILHNAKGSYPNILPNTYCTVGWSVEIFFDWTEQGN